jgi:hypothetical protein
LRLTARGARGRSERVAPGCLLLGTVGERAQSSIRDDETAINLAPSLQTHTCFKLSPFLVISGGNTAAQRCLSQAVPQT